MGIEKSEQAPFQDTRLLDLTMRVVTAYVGRTPMPAEELPDLIFSVHACLAKLDQSPVHKKPNKPAVPIKKSITDDYLICLEDGEKFKSLRRHLRSKYDMSPEEYREKWMLPHDYPMVAPSYARQRSMLAKQMKLGQNKK